MTPKKEIGNTKKTGNAKRQGKEKQKGGEIKKKISKAKTTKNSGKSTKKPSTQENRKPHHNVKMTEEEIQERMDEAERVRDHLFHIYEDPPRPASIHSESEGKDLYCYVQVMNLSMCTSFLIHVISNRRRQGTNRVRC